MIKASIIGITGYAGIELLRLLNQHPEVEIRDLVSNSQPGKKLIDVYPQFAGVGDFILQEYNPEKLSDSDIVFTALPHGVSQEIVADLFKSGLKVIDLSGDFRYQDPRVYQDWYDIEQKYPELLGEAVYGLAEINRDRIKKSDLVANPGCYPTASLLGLIPLINNNVIRGDSIIIDAKSGASGAGRGLKLVTQFNEADESVKAYNVATHRHTSEIEAVLSELSEEDITVSFTPHLMPMKRGILATIYADIDSDYNQADLIDIYRDYYTDCSFVQILDSSLTPETKYVAGTNYCHIGIRFDTRTGRIIVLSVIDNLGKGAAGQAVQNMNLMFDLPETIGLQGTAVFP